jgi:rubrerythrin
MTAAGGDASEQQGVESKSVARVELLAQRNEDRSAVGRLSPGGGRAEQQQYVGVPPPGSGVQPVAPATMISRVRAPFIGLTLTACVAIAGWQSKRVYKERQQGLLEEFGATMAAYLGEEREMASTLKLFRGQLGPGSHTVPMFVAFLKQMAMDRPADIQTILDLKRAVALMQMTPGSLKEALPLAMDGLQSQPSTLGKLVFVAERAVPAAATAAELRSKFPTWSPETVATLQRAMLENTYREMCNEPDADSAENLSILGLTEGEASRLREDVEEKAAAAAAAVAAVEEEKREREQLQDAVKKASEYKPRVGRNQGAAKDAPVADDDEDDEVDDADRGDGTHEYECTKCGYIMFPAAGREFKFYGDDFKCPTCGAGKDSFVDNGVVEV